MRKLTKEERVKCTLDWLPLDFHQSAEIIIEQQDARELPLVDALRFYASSSLSPNTANAALAAYDRLDAAPEPTLLEAAKALVLNPNLYRTSTSTVCDAAAFAALRAAVERAEREGK